ncbi:MAG: peptidase M20, partial [Balneolales bacterium]|nr:peptidase M20 [Balneolales bacterium]
MNFLKRRPYLFFLLIAIFACSAPQAQLNTEQLIADLEYLSSDELGGRLVGTEGNERAQFYIMQRFTESGVQKLGDRYTRTFQFERNGAQMEGVNIIGVVPGESESMIVLTAHFDHIGTRDSLIFNG